MTDLEFSAWPRVAARLHADFGESDLAALAGGVQSAVERRRPFVLVIVGPRRLLDARSHDVPLLRSLRRRRAEVGTWCRGVAYVVSGEPDPRAHGETARALERFWGCPVLVNSGFEDAVAWLDERLRAVPAARSLKGKQ